MITLVTGATGFVGSAVARHLLAAGHHVRVLARPTSNRANLAGLDVETVTGDLLDRASLAEALSGCDTLFHVAADYRIWCPNPQDLYEHNVSGTRNIMEIAAASGIRRIVYTSSVATLGTRPDGRPADETTPSHVEDMIGHYKRSKFLAEAEVRRMAAQGLPVVTVNPSTPIGPGDIRPTPTGRMIRDAAAGRIPAFVDTGLNLVHVDDVAAGHLLALEHGDAGRRYILGGEDLTLREILARIAAITGRRAPRIRLPRQAVLPVAWIAQGWARLTGGPEPLTTVDGLKMAGKHMYFSSARARDELGYRPRPVDEALRDAVAWFTQGGRR